MQTSLWHMRQTASYWHSPSGIAQLAWEQQILDTFSERVFGYYALSIGLNSLNILQHSTIPYIVRLDANLNKQRKSNNLFACLSGNDQGGLIDLQDWPIQNDSLDYIVLPHVLEFSIDPHAVLREAARCLRPGGYMSITAFNPHSMLGLQAGHTELGHRAHWLNRTRLIDWLQLLNLHADRGAFGQWRPMSERANRFERLAWLDKAGERWWPHWANVFAMRVVKRVSPDLRQFVTQNDSLIRKVLRPAIPPATATAGQTQSFIY